MWASLVVLVVKNLPTNGEDVGRSYLEPPPWSPVLQHEKERAGILFSHMSERNHS